MRGINEMQWIKCIPANPVIRSVDFICPAGQLIHGFTPEQEEWLSTMFAVLPGNDKSRRLPGNETVQETESHMLD